MEQVMLELLKRKLHESRKDAIKSSKSGMRQLRSEENTEAFRTDLENGDLSVVFQRESMQCVQFDLQRDLIKKIDRALKLIDDGDYGICEECGDPIGEKRLRIVPFALYCRDCQESMEMERRMNRSRTAGLA